MRVLHARINYRLDLYELADATFAPRVCNTSDAIRFTTPKDSEAREFLSIFFFMIFNEREQGAEREGGETDSKNIFNRSFPRCDDKIAQTRCFIYVLHFTCISVDVRQNIVAAFSEISGLRRVARET